MPALNEALVAATRLHQAGQLQEAERIYRQILAVEPDHVQALHQASVLVMQLNQFPQAVAWLTSAIRLDRNRPELYANLGEAQRRIGNLSEAALQTENALKLNPKFVTALSNLGLIRRNQGDRAAAAECFREAIKLQPEDARLRILLGDSLHEQGQYLDADACFRRAIRIAPEDASAHFLLATTLIQLRRPTDAIAAFQTVVKLQPNNFEAYNNLGTVFKEQRSLVEAEAHYRLALRVSPDHPVALSNLGSVLADQGRSEEALPPCLRACELAPTLDMAFYNAGYAWEHLGSFDEALAAYERAIELNTANAPAQTRRGSVLQLLGRLDEAIESFRRGVEFDPGNHGTHTNLVYALNFPEKYDAEAVFAEHRKWGQRHADPFSVHSLPPRNDRTPDRRLRIGYVSAHFYAHAVNFFVEPILQSHDRGECDIFCYADVRSPDAVTERLKPLAEWRDVLGQSDDQVADLVRQDKIDILVDLAGHIGGARLMVFARKPAPVQVTYIGYQNTTGMQAMDYRLTDAWSDPIGETDRFYTERLFRLPGSFFCYLPTPGAPGSETPPIVSQSHVTFGSFNNIAKVTPQVLSVWAKILLDVPNSRLTIVSLTSPGMRRRVTEHFNQQGVAAERIHFVERCARGEYLEWINRTDIALDPFPFNGHTTTLDTLWTGVPVVTMVGDRYASRFGASGLVSLGLTDLLAHSPEEYHRVAVELAGNVPRLCELRQTLRTQMRASALCDFAGFTRNLEAAYRQMWIDWCGRATT